LQVSRIKKEREGLFTKSAENYKGSFLKDRPIGNIEDIKVIGRIQVLFGGRGVI